MSIEIDINKCVGCGKCTDICPGNLIYERDDKKAFIKYPKDCWGCTACIKECKFSAIDYLLSPQIGGSGGKMNVKEMDNYLIWNLQRSSGDSVEIKVDRTESNRY